MERERVTGKEKNYQESVYQVVFSVDNRRHWGYSKGKQFNTKNEVLTDGLQVFWAGSLEAIPRSSLRNWLKGNCYRNYRQEAGKQEDSASALLQVSGNCCWKHWPCTKKMHDPSRPSLSSLHSVLHSSLS